MAEVIDTTQKETQTQQTQQMQVNQQTQQTVNKEVNVEQVKKETLSEFLRELGVEDEESLRGIVTKSREDDEANKTELQKKDDALTATTKELATEREARIIAEAKLAAIELGAKPDLVNDLVIIAKSKVTKDKDINAAIAEIKEGSSGEVYFLSKDEEEETEENNKTKGKTVTRARVTKPSEKHKEGTDIEEHVGSMAERLLSGRKKNKGHYFG